MPSPREVVLKFMEGAGHNPISQVESLLNSIPMMDINVNIEHPLVGLQQLQDGQHTIVDVAKTRSLGLLGMMKTSRPVDSVLVLSLGQQGRRG